jgi:bifunctional non-homologous end joining protein LigD
MTDEKFKFTNREKIFWPEEGYSKGDVLDYYEAIAPTILPYLKNRPLVMLRHPNGINQESFFQKQVDRAHLPSWAETVRVRHQEKYVDYILVQNIESLLYVINLGCIEVNPFHSQVSNLENPDYMIFDLDPEDIDFKHVINTTLVIHNILNSLEIANYCKTSGKRGLHIFVPLGGQINFEQSQELAKVIAFMAQCRLPDIISLERSPKNRQKRVYIDFLRNSRHQTVASAYSLRPIANAQVSAPLYWEEVNEELDPRIFNIETMPQRIYDHGDLFRHILDKNINLSKSLNKLQDIFEVDVKK